MTSIQHPQRKNFLGLLICTLGLGAVLGACASSAAPAEAPPSASEDETAAPADAPPAETASLSFDDMSPGQKLEHMKTVIAPKMAKVFEESPDALEEAFSCKTCHGPEAASGNFDMPSDSLPKLSEEELAEHPEMTKFMKERVTPVMA